MRKILTATLLTAATLFANSISTDACTNVLVTKGASADGSNIISYAADSHQLFGELYFLRAASWPSGAMRKINEWDTGKYLGEIPQVPYTYQRVGNMNEHQLIIAETTYGGRHELEDTTGIMDYGSLIYVALERARTAREAIGVIVALANEYGYYSSGESFSIADKDEVWVMDLIGKGMKMENGKNLRKGIVWVARRVPDGYISGHANNARIHTFPLDDPETLYSPDVISFARKCGYYKGKDEDFDFSRAYSVYDMLSMRGCDGRVWSYFNRFAAQGSMDAYLPWILRGQGEPMPLWVRPERLLTAQDLKDMMRDHFEGTPMDMTKDIGAGPFNVPYRWRPLTYKVDGVEYTHERAIATQQTGFSFVADINNARPDAMRGILWFGVDDANTCVYIPVFNSLKMPPYQLAHGNGDLLTLSWDSMFWVTNYVANQAYNRYSQMIGDIRKVQESLEVQMTISAGKAEEMCRTLSHDDAAKYLAEITNYWAEKCTKDYRALGDTLFVKYLDGNIKRQNEDGTFSRTPYGLPDKPAYGGYDERYYRSIVNEQGDRLKVIPVE